MENINQMPNLQPIQPISPVKNQNVFKYLFIVSIIVLLGVIIGFYYVLNNKINQLSNKQTTQITPTPTQTQITETNNEVVPTTIPTIASTESTLVEKDSDNNLYTNNKVGFSLILPKTINDISGNCQEKIPVTFFEKDNAVYFAANSYFKLNNGSCLKENTNIQSILNSGSPAAIRVYFANAKNDSEIEQFIQSKYGLGCQLGEKTQSTSVGISDIKILGDGKGLDETKCSINFIVKPKYNAIKGKLIIFELGQACNLYEDNTNTCHDFDVIDSLKFN